MIFSLIPTLFNTVSADCRGCNGPSGNFADSSHCDEFSAIGSRFGSATNTSVEPFAAQTLASTCPGVLLPPISVKSFNYLRFGPIISKYRKCVAKTSSNWGCELKDPFVICTKRSPCSSLTEEQFYRAVVGTIKLISGNRYSRISEMTERVIKSIYFAAIETSATVEQLINFTSIAMHNVYLLTHFPYPNPANNSIGNTTRGLLQLLSLGAYEKITQVSEINYVQKPYLLNTFTKVTIHDEFRAFLRFYNNSSAWGVESFIDSVQRLQSEEAHLVNLRSAVAVLNGTYIPTNILEKRVLNRFNIYYVLSALIFKNEESVVVKVYEN